MAFRFVSRCYQCVFFCILELPFVQFGSLKSVQVAAATHCMNHKLIKVFATTVCSVRYYLSIFEVQFLGNIKKFCPKIKRFLYLYYIIFYMYILWLQLQIFMFINSLKHI